MPTPSRVLVACLKMKDEIACANSTSTSASVRTLAAVASAKARNQNCDAVAPMKPANSDGRHCARDRAQHGAVAQREIGGQQRGLQHQAEASVKVAAITKLGMARASRIAPR